MVPMDSDELTGEASGEPAPRGMGPYTSSSSESEDIRTGHTHQGGLLNELSAAETLSFSTDVSDTRLQRKKRKLRKSRKSQDRVDNDRTCSPCILVRISHRFQAQQCMHV